MERAEGWVEEVWHLRGGWEERWLGSCGDVEPDSGYKQADREESELEKRGLRDREMRTRSVGGG